MIFTFVSEGNEELKFITELRYDSIDNISVRMENHRGNLETNEIDERIKYKTYELPRVATLLGKKRSETKFQTLKKGLYFIHFYSKENQKRYCGSSALFIRKISKKEVKKNELDTELKNIFQEKE